MWSRTATSLSLSGRRTITTYPRLLTPTSNKPPKGIQSSTSAHDFKLNHPRARPPGLPSIDPPKWSAEEAVTNIIYNTPPPSSQPYVRHVLNCLVQNEPGVLSRVSGILAARGFNIDSLVVCGTEVKDLSRMCIVLKGQDGVIEQARRQLEDLVPVWAVLDYTHTRTIERELLLCKVSILGPEYFEDQLAQKIEEAKGQEAQGNAEEAGQSGGSDLAKASVAHGHGHGEGLEEGSPAQASVDATQAAAAASHPGIASTTQFYTPPREQLTPSEALRQKHLHFQAISHLALQFQGKVVDVSNDCVTVEVAGKTSRIDAFLKLVRPYGVLEAARTGMMVMPRSHVDSPWVGMADEEAVEETEVMDATLLPPG